MQSDTIVVNSEVLVWARESIAMSRSQVSQTTGISDTRLSNLERGERMPTIEELRSLSRVYKRSIATLLLSKRPPEKPLPKDRRTVDSKEIGHFHPKTVLAVRRARAFAQSYVELKNELGQGIGKLSFHASLNDDPKEVAGRTRKEFNLAQIREDIGEGNASIAFDAFIESLDSVGIAVFQLSLTEDNLRGFSILDEVLPIIGVKRSDSPTAKNFTLFHELGHVILNDEGSCDPLEGSSSTIERWCNAFAAEVLIPSEELMRMPIVAGQRASSDTIWRHKDLVDIGNTFHVGPLAVLRSLLEIGLTTPAFYNEKHRLWNRPSFGRAKNLEGRNIAKETVKERGKTYVSMAFRAFDQNRINLKDLSDYLGIRLSYIPKTRQLLNIW